MIIDNMKYPIVLGRDMLDDWMIGMDHTQNTILFLKKDIEKESGGVTDCFLTRNIVLDANSVSQVDFDMEADVKGGILIGSSELA